MCDKVSTTLPGNENKKQVVEMEITLARNVEGEQRPYLALINGALLFGVKYASG